MNFESWLQSVPPEIKDDSLWKMEAYRLSLFVVDLGWHDVTRLTGDRRTLETSGQLYRALGSIEANISAGYSLGSGRDRARFYEYALGSDRESRGWYYKARHVLGEAVAKHRIGLITHVARLLLRMIPDQGSFGSFVQEDSMPYGTEQREADWPASVDPAEVSGLLENALLP